MSSTGEVFRAKCGVCGGDVHFNPGTETLECLHCGNQTSIESSPVTAEEQDLEKVLQEMENASGTTPLQSIQAIKCESCGAETTFPEKVTSWKCAYCDTPLVLNNSKKENILSPRYLLPFKISRKEANEKFVKWVHSLWFAPDDLKKIATQTQDKAKGIYVPFWTYDMHTTTQYVGCRGEKYTVKTSYRDSSGKLKTRTETRIRWYPPQSGVVECFFDDVLVCASRSIPEHLKNYLNNWDKEALVEVKPEYLAGFISEVYQINLREGFYIAKEKIQPMIESHICKDIGGDTQKIISRSTQYSNMTFKHILLPVWISSFRYNNRVYRFVVNARTGQVYGERPWSVFKIILLILGIALAVWILVLFSS